MPELPDVVVYVESLERRLLGETLERVRLGRPTKSVLMVGLRGVGKTVLLDRMRDDAEAVGIQTLRIEAPEGRSLPAIVADEDELPSIELLTPPSNDDFDAGEDQLDKLATVLIDTMETFGVKGRVIGRTTGPVVTRYEIKPAPGVKVQKIAALADDLALTMKAKSIQGSGERFSKSIPSRR